MLERAREIDGRLVAAAVVVAVFGVLLVFRATTGTTPWNRIGVEPGNHVFADLYAVTSTWDCDRRGIDPFPTNPCNRFGAIVNFPRVWTKLGRVGLDSGDTTPLAILLAVIFFAAALLVPGPLGAGEGLVYAAALVAPATMLGVQRANVDLLMFALVALGLLLLRRSAWAGAAAITLAAVLKLFPVFALAIFVRERRRWAAGAVSTVLFAVYVVLTLDDLRTIRHVIPRVIGNSYGAGVVVDALHQHGYSWIQSSSSVRFARFAVLALGLAVAAVLLLARRGTAAGDERRLDAFCAGASIYLGTYVFGNNFDYRLVFLVLCVPQLCAWSQRRGRTVPLPAAALVGLIATLWLSSQLPPLPFGLQAWYVGLSFPPEEVVNWLLFAWLAAALGAIAVTDAHRLARR